MPDLYNYSKKKNEQSMIEADVGKRKKEQFIENLREGDVVNDLYAVKIKNPPRPYKRGTWFGLAVTDKTGVINIKFWGGENKDRVKRLYDSFKVGDVVQVRLGNVEIYEEKPQISINETSGGLRRCSPNEYDVSDFIPSLDEKKIKDFFDLVKKDVKTIIKTLSLNYKIGLISNTGVTPGGIIIKVFKKLEILKYFMVTIFSDEIGFYKPKSIIFEKALNKLKCKPEHAIHVGDLLQTDIEGAKAYVMRTIWFNDKNQPKILEIKPDY